MITGGSLIDFQSPAQVVKGLGARVRAHRMAQSLRQEDLAELSGVALSTLRKLERTGQGSIQHYVLLLRALGLAGRLVDLLPEISPSPMALLARSPRGAGGERKRIRRPRQERRG